MLQSHRAPAWAATARLAVVLIFLGLCLFTGGASRVDVASLVLLQPAAVVATVVALLIPGAVRWRAVAAPLILLAALAMIMAIQLLPLPPSIWTSLSGHAPFAEAATVAGLPQPWRPISLTPDLTLASLIGLSVPLAVLVGFASLSREQTYFLLLFLLGAVAISAIFGLAQIAGGPQSSFYLYAVTSNNSPVGLFANRNHQALLLAMAFPLLALWLVMPGKHLNAGVKFWVSAASAFAAVALLLVTGSRAGLLFGLLGIAFAAYLLRRLWPPTMTLPIGVRNAIMIVAGLSVVGLAAAVWLYSRDETAQRLIATSLSEEARYQFFPYLWSIMVDFLPVGSGFGSFDPVFRYYEPFHLLKPTYLNHAHNDLIELIMTGGLPALLLLAVFVVWFVRRTWFVLANRTDSRAYALASVAAMMILLTLLGSLVDYPLRTPLMAAIFALACAFLHQSKAADSEA